MKISIPLILIVVLLNVNKVNCGCGRGQDGRACEALCVRRNNNNIKSYNSSSEYECELRMIVIVPNNLSIEASSRKVLPVIDLAIESIKRQQIIPPFLNVKVAFYDDQCDASYATVSTMDGTSKDCGHVLFGPSCDYALAPVGRIAKYFYSSGLPIITSAGYTFDFEDKKTSCDHQFYMLTRAGLLSYKSMAFFMMAVMKEFNWSRVVFFYDKNGHAEVTGPRSCFLCMTTFAEYFKPNNITYSNFALDAAKTSMVENLRREVGLTQSIIIMCASPSTIREIMLAADELNMVNSGEYVFFNIEIFGSMTEKTRKPWYAEDDTDENNSRAKNAYTALLQLIARQPEDDDYKMFSNEVKNLTKEKYKYIYAEDEPVSTFVTAFYDAVLLYAYALNDSIKTLGEEVALRQAINGTEIVRLMWNRSFKGITGNVTIDSNGDRISDYSLLDMNPDTGQFEIIANYFHDGGLQFVYGKQIHWSGGREEAPPDKPKCGFDGSLCPDKSLPGYAILSLVLGCCVVVMSIASIIGYRHYKLEAEINSMTWKININDVLSCNPNGRYRGSIHSMMKRGSQATIYSEDLHSLPGDRQIYINFGFYKGCKVAIKKINVNNISLNRSLLLEFKKMKDIQHDHLVRFYGACLEPAAEAFILTEYCPKGSLQDILENDTIKLDWMFKISLMHDIVKGMSFLHSTDINSHGNLKSSNCVVDSRFVLKITDFGLHALRRQPDDASDKESYAYWKKFLWTAPELLRNPIAPPQGSQKGDVYSFGIIIQEIVCRQGPFFLGDIDKSPKDIIKLVKQMPETFGTCVPFRPKVDETSYEDVNNIMVKCWAEDQNERPDFSILKQIIRKLNKENESGNILDNLLQRMEQYADNLEALVDERTQDYFEEKRKCEELLYQLLPRSVASQLILGKSVIAETYDQVTIYFSDIVGFTSISAESTPMQVVDLLNDLYTCFDSIIENFDVYKVETIGDAYMVVSGLPVRNGNLHAREISRMALALLGAVYKFSIRHRPNEQLKLRIGLHSGPCVAGVVGLKMPRYCLFGDTVNTASRMESNGEPLKIHTSESTKKILDTFGTFDISTRGLVSMKGKGEMMTYWLNGEKMDPLCNGFRKSKSEEDPKCELRNGATTGSTGGILTNNNNCSTNNNNNQLRKQNSVSYNFIKSNSTTRTSMTPKTRITLGDLTQPLLTKIN